MTTPGSSVAAVATAAGVPVAHARKALIAWEKAGRATRAPGGYHDGKRAPDTWQATIPATPPLPTTPTDPAASTDNADSADNARKAHDADVSAGDEDMDEAAVAQAREALSSMRDAITEGLRALDVGDRAAVVTAAETIYAASGSTRRLVRTAAHPGTRGTSGQVRSQPGELRTKVAAHLAAHPGKDFSPHEIGKVIGHSAGAIANALDRLISLGEAASTCDRPRRFTAAASS